MGNFFGDLGKAIGETAENVSKFTGDVVDATAKITGDVVDATAKITGDTVTEIATTTSNVASSAGQVIQSGTKITEDGMMVAMDWAYATGINGLPGEKSVYDLAEDYLAKYDSEKAIEKLIQAQTTKSAVSGFVTGFGGLLTLPVTVPANISSVLVFQMRMIATIAHIRGYDLKDDQV